MARNTSAMKRGFNYDLVNGRLAIMVDGVEALRLTKSSTGVDISLFGDTPASNYLTFDASSPSLSFNRSNASTGSVVSISAASSATSGNIYGLRMSVESTGASTGITRGIRCEAELGESAESTLLEAGLFTAKVSSGSATVTDIKPLTGHVSIGSNLTVSGVVCCVNAHMQTRSDETIGVHTGVYIKNEAVGGNGLCLAQGAIYVTEASLGGSVKGYECLVDASTATMTAQSGNIVHLIKFKDSGGTARVLLYDSDDAGAVSVASL